MSFSVTFEQLFRTPSSEQWKILDGDGGTLGRVDVHFGPASARVTVAVAPAVSEADLEDLLATVDERLVPAKARGDLRITVWRGESLGTFAP